MKIEKAALSQIRINELNPRSIPENKFNLLIQSILVFPKMLEMRPVVVDETYTALGGNMRTKALDAISKMHPAEIAAHLYPCPDYQRMTQGEKDAIVKHWGAWLENPTAYIVKASTLTKAEKEQFIIKDNASYGKWDFDALSSLFDTALLPGWGVDVWQEEFAPMETNEPQTQTDMPEVSEDDFSEESDHIEVRCKRGDIWELGQHRLMCGDSISLEDVKKLTGGGKIDMVFTDPPYGYKYESHHQDTYEMLKNDDKILDYVPAMLPYLNDCAVYSFCGWQSVNKWLDYFMNTPLKIKNLIVWKKNNWSMGDLKCSYAGQYELCVYLNNGKKELNGKRDTDIWEFDRVPPTLHPTMKPLDMIAYALGKSSKDGDTILDVFGGSGSTLIACEQTNRKCRMMELDPHYCDVIIARWEKLTGKTAKIIEATA